MKATDTGPSGFLFRDTGKGGGDDHIFISKMLTYNLLEITVFKIKNN